MADPKKNAPPAPAAEGDALLAAQGELEQLKLRVQELEGDQAHLLAENKGLHAEFDRVQKLLRAAEDEKRKALDAQRAQFDAAWKAREDELAATPTPAPADEAPAPKRYRARGNHQLVRDGARVKLVHGTLLPVDFDVTTLPAGGYEEAV